MSRAVDIGAVSLRRPVKLHAENTAGCPRCRSDVGETVGSHPIPRRRLGGHGPSRVISERVVARGFRCDACEYVLAIAPEHAVVDRDRWVTIGAVFADLSQRPILIPRKQLREGSR